MKNLLLSYIVLFSNLCLAQNNTPAYDLLKPYFSSNKTQVVVVGVSNDSLFQSILFQIHNDKKMIDKTYTTPCLIVTYTDSLYYIHQRTISYNQTFKEVWEDTVTIHYYGYDSYPLVCSRYSDLFQAADYDRTHQEKPADIESSMHTWDGTFFTQIEYILPDMIQIASYYDGYSGGAHPNHSYNTYLIAKKSLLNSYLDDEGHFVIKEDDFDLIKNLKPLNLDSIKRVLYFKGASNCFDDYDEGIQCNEFNVHQFDGMQIGDIDTAEYYVDLDNLNAILVRTPNAFDVVVEAYADAPYAYSGDYSFTASCRQGRLPHSLNPYMHQTLSLSILKTIDKEVVDFYATEDNSAILLLRNVNSGLQLRCVYNEGKSYLDMPLSSSMNVVQFQVLRDALAQRLLNEIGQTK